MTHEDKDNPPPNGEPPQFTPAEMKLFAVGGRVVLVAVVVGSIVVFGLLAWFVWRLIQQNVPIQ